MRVLVIGGGAREHALVARLAAETPRPDLLCAPGNPGIAALARTVPVDVANPDALAALAAREAIDFTVVGPEVPLSAGVVDRFTRDGQRIFGPTQAAARLESSKAFAKAFMQRHGIPTARFRSCDTVDEALAAVRSAFGLPVVLKADGLAAGKGVVIATTLEEAEAAVVAAMRDQRFGAAGARLVVEECLTGTEVSFFAVCDGERAVAIGTAQDHKRIWDDDRGPNTGGMGAFAPSPLVDAALQQRIMRDIVEPVVAGMGAEGHAFRGFLYVGLMLTAAGPQVIEFNVRLGDPEAQVILPRLTPPLLPLLEAAAAGQLGMAACELSHEKFVGVVLASEGYPESTRAGDPISGLDEAAQVPNVSVLHAGTALEGGRIVTAGGRVLTVVGHGPDFAQAIERAYAGARCIAFAGAQMRSDIGRKALIGDAVG
jgi:phosphoribosylamine--glycine ligase